MTPTEPLEVVLYTRAGCHLCDEAKDMLMRLRSKFAFEVREINIDPQPELVAQYGEKVPVIAVGGKARQWGCINETLLRRLLRAESRK